MRTLRLFMTLVGVDSVFAPAVGAQEPLPRATVDTTAPLGSFKPALFDSTTTPCHDFHRYAVGRRKTYAAGLHDSVVQHRLAHARHEHIGHEEATIIRWLEQARTAASDTASHASHALGALYGSCLANDGIGRAADSVGLSRATLCVKRIRLQGLLAFYKGYFQHVQSPAWEAQVQATFEAMKAAAGHRLQAVPWLTESGKQRALAKLAVMRMGIRGAARAQRRLGAARQHLPPYEVDYASVTFSPTDFQGNVVRLLAAEDTAYSRWARALGHTMDEIRDSLTKWRPRRAGRYIVGRYVIEEVTTGGGYDEESVYFSFGNGHLQRPHFDPQADPATNFAGAGWIMGHEMMHAFDEASRLFSAEEMAAGADSGFRRREQMLADQLRATGMPLAWPFGLDEWVASVGGMAVAYQAFEEEMRGKPRTRIAGFTPEQRFFLTYADATQGRSEGVNAIVANMPAFAQAFGCQPGDSMAHPLEKRVAIF